MKMGRGSGFTLVELMIVVAVIGVLAAVVWPSYQEQVRKGKRAEGRAALLRAAQLQERFFTDRNQYAPQADLATASGVVGATFPTIYSGENPNTVDGAPYTIAVALAPSADGTPNMLFTLTAAPTAAFNDPTCGNLTLTSAGVRSWATSPASPERCRW